jgi:hypothetical protein
MSRKKRRYKDLQPKPPVEEKAAEPEKQEPTEQEEHVTRYKAVVRSPLGEWWHDNKKRVRLFAIIGGVGLLAGWLLFELFSLIL